VSVAQELVVVVSNGGRGDRDGERERSGDEERTSHERPPR